MNPAILHTEVQAFIQANLHTDISRILLSKSPFSEVSSRELAEQIDSKVRCEKKLPIWFSTAGIYYPPKISIEQASSEATAKFKATLAKGTTLLDLTGGFGVDSYYFADAGMQVLHAELNPELSDIAKYNAQILNAPGISFYQGDGMDLLSDGRFFDTIYVDPSRRIKTQKVFMLKDCEPDIPQNLNHLLQHCSRLIVKTSPLLDIQSGLGELEHVSEIHVVSFKNDCKELLWIIDPETQLEEPEVYADVLEDERNGKFRFKISEERHTFLTQFSEPLKYLYEPDVALLKAGSFKLISRNYDVIKLHKNSHLYTSNEVNENFLGRKLLVLKWGVYKNFMKENTVQKANVISRNFPLSPQEIKKKHKFIDGGDDFLIFTTGSQNQLLVIWCKRLD